MRLKSWLVAALGLLSLVGLIAVSLNTSARKAEDIYGQLDALHTDHPQVDVILRRLRSDINLSGILVRDYLLDAAPERAPEYREQIAELRRTNTATLNELTPLVERRDQTALLQRRLNDYWNTFEPLFDWTPDEKLERSAAFLRSEVMPRRDAALALAAEVEAENNADRDLQQEEATRRLTAFRDDLHWLLAQTVLLGLGVAAIVVIRLRVLERRWQRAEQQLRQLSQQVVDAQEEERKHLSRELHDHVAQVLTGLRMELGRIERTSTGAGPAVAESKNLVDELFQTVRNLALGLRPSMLDDFGLQAALEWLVRDVMGRTSLDVELRVQGDFEALPDKHRTCVYRVVQEALTNVVRHAQATAVTVDVSTRGRRLLVRVTDDGIGLDRKRPRTGLGLRGIEERVRELNGTTDISGSVGAGTTIAIDLPLPEEIPVLEEVALARAAG